jgi:hypothetical protein
MGQSKNRCWIVLLVTGFVIANFRMLFTPLYLIHHLIFVTACKSISLTIYSYAFCLFPFVFT